MVMCRWGRQQVLSQGSGLSGVEGGTVSGMWRHLGQES